MKIFEHLSEAENKALLKFPAYISLLAANNDGQLDETEKKSAARFAHIKTFSSHPLLSEFYQEADKIFEQQIEQLDNELPRDKNEREKAIKEELAHLRELVSKLGKNYPKVMQRSMKSFKDHVSKAHHNVLVDFMFPMPIKGLTH